MSIAGAAGIGVYGKVAGQADFLRSNAGGFSRAGLDGWLQEGMETLRKEGTTLPAPPTSFLLAPPGAGAAFIGAFAPSADAAGRSFPLVVFAEIATGELGDTLASTPAAYSAFTRACGLLASSGATVPGPELVAQAQALSAELPATSARGRGDGVAGATVGSLASALGDFRALAYALSTLTGACSQAAKSGGAGGAAGASPPLTVDAPAPTPAARELWIEIARRRLGWRGAFPSLLWTDGPEGRLLIILGPPSGGALSYLANPRHRSNRLWPLRTTVASVVDQAAAALTPARRQILESPSAPLADVIAAYSA